ncbi:MAG: sugar-transfer associated ATP-grasp domain-containing protein, partial [Gemmatimonadales bacterium]
MSVTVMGTARIGRWRQRLLRHTRALASAWRYSGELAREHGLSRLGMLGEAAMLAVRGRMNVDTYFHYRLFDPELSPDAKRSYLSDAPRENARLWAALTPTRYRCLYENKLVFNRYFSSFGLPLATIFGVFDPEVGRSVEGQPLRTEAELGEFIRRFRSDGFVFKPAEGVKGHQIVVLTGAAPGDPDGFLSLSGERYDAAALVAVARDTAALELQNPDSNASSFLLEERIRPHPELAELVGPTLCTVRVVTVVALDGSPKIVGSVYKLQPKAVGVDHLIYGAVGSWVDPDTGALGPGRNRAGYEYTSVIPGTDRPFVGYRLPCWSQV